VLVTITFHLFVYKGFKLVHVAPKSIDLQINLDVDGAVNSVAYITLPLDETATSVQSLIPAEVI
jgi:hypothetical protein